MIKFDKVTKTFGSDGQEVHAVKDVSLTINKGEIFGIIGFSGAGKSTLLRLVNLLERPTFGKIIVNEKEISTISQTELRKLRSRIGMIFQSFNLLSSRNVAGNIAYPLKLAKVPKDKRDERVEELLRFVGLEDKANKYPEQLSGGQKQRVGIARALATSPDILICDEATSALDPETTEEILNLLKKVNKEYDITILLITHEMHVIRSICSRVAVMEDGKVIEQGNVYDIFSNPQSKTTRNFISSVLNDNLSPRLLDRLHREHSGNIYRLIFTGGVSSKPIISQIAKKYNLDFNIMYGSIHELQDQLYGNLIVELIGTDSIVKEAVNELREIVEVKEVLGSESRLDHVLA
ncbi:methionine ABC transporter ATP-binding protein [Terrihalobacillus insolitus]|uniref:methionine ABC transporter ATP-binding protein n=1 Tax=Terrihalobacillus insolitus TaxID=2950438 RepID=UPI00234019CE|nr:methionine ABC transporter ATP-binding protein [Terrihalobacillus insolitus]MDC3414028.1 methionine ABC transporter ATP-binding protein [Terrihalobacillus insolitus]